MLIFVCFFFVIKKPFCILQERRCGVNEGIQANTIHVYHNTIISFYLWKTRSKMYVPTQPHVARASHFRMCALHFHLTCIPIGTGKFYLP